jgi:hypothetical protein
MVKYFEFKDNEDLSALYRKKIAFIFYVLLQ